LEKEKEENEEDLNYFHISKGGKKGGREGGREGLLTSAGHGC
jgi:hypothetical protein